MTATRRQVRLLSLVPFPPRLDAPHGGGRTTANLVLALARQNPVALLHLRRPGEPEADPALHEHCDLVEELVSPTDRVGRVWRRSRKGLLLATGTPIWAIDVAGDAVKTAVAATLERWQPDVVQVEYGVTVEAAGLASPATPLVLVQHEPGTVRAEEDLDAREHTRSRLVRRLDYLAWRRFERSALRRATATVVFTERDRACLSHVAPGADIRVIPLGTSPPAQPLDPYGASASVIFVGSFIHPPNIEAALRLLRAIMPRVRQRHPDVTTYVVGDLPPPELRREARSGVIVTGFVDRVEPYLDRAAVAVAPLWTGGGMRVKVLETLAAGKALVATPRAVTGLSVADGEQALIADDDAAFADAICLLLENRGRRAELASSARAWALEQPGWSDVAAEYERLYESLLDGRRRT